MTIQLPFIKQLIGHVLPGNKHGHAGRALEKLIESMGLGVNRGKGLDLPALGIEVKTRAVDATSPQSVATMLPETIIKTPYEDSVVCKKLQWQLRVKLQKLNDSSNNTIVVDATLHDFSLPHIQKKFKEAYEHAREQIKANPNLDNATLVSGQWGYFERKKKCRSFQFRFSHTDMLAIESMATTTYSSLFEEV